MSSNEKLARGLRALADLVEANPELAQDIYLPDVLVMPYQRAISDQRAWLVEWKNAALAHGHSFHKHVDDKDFEGHVDFDAFKVRVLADRDKVCERVVVSTERVTKTVKDPAALAAVPEIEVTEEVEVVEYRCRPLLAAETAGGAP